VNRTILVVDDDPLIRRLIATTLEDVSGFDLVEACDGLEALERVRQQPFDLIVCDLKMPRLDGAAFYRELEKFDSTMTSRILFVTGDVAGTDAERFLEDSRCRWLAKPFRLRDLLRTAAEMIG
jgi:two-component system chemotaxis response regulator CheY